MRNSRPRYAQEMKLYPTSWTSTPSAFNANPTGQVVGDCRELKRIMSLVIKNSRVISGIRQEGEYLTVCE
ncbi:MAG: hypothetical protein JWL59_3289 [Chthoniobacteraceae bacterium]|nr:hypothetical protein [Chthoniobacteraceae bacterium]